jgi:hypothetical protein
VQLTATGGHAGNDMAHAAIRRWVAPREVAVRIEGEVSHSVAPGNGVNARIVSGRSGTLGHWTVHNTKAETKFDRVELKRGDTLDFVVDYNGDLNNDMFAWAPVVTSLESSAPLGEAGRWTAAEDFPTDASRRPQPLDPWEMYAHVLLSTNEFMFVD